MSVLPLIIAPHPIFKQKSQPVTAVTEATRGFIRDLFDTLYAYDAIGMAAPMVGRSERIAIVDIRENDQLNPRSFINPEIVERSAETQTHSEGSLCFPYIDAAIKRAQSIRLRYLDEQGVSKEETYEGFLATVIQHEVDYLDGVVFLDYLSRTKKDMLLKKMLKQQKLQPVHVHGAHCHH